MAGHGADRRFGDVWRKANDAPTRMVRQGYFGAVARTFGVAAARRRCDQLFIFGQDTFAVGNRLLMAARCG